MRFSSLGAANRCRDESFRGPLLDSSVRVSAERSRVVVGACTRDLLALHKVLNRAARAVAVPSVVLAHGDVAQRLTKRVIEHGGFDQVRHHLLASRYSLGGA